MMEQKRGVKLLNKRKIFALITIFVLLFVSGCSGVNQVPVANVSPDFDKEQDLSLYIIEEEAKGDIEPIPLDPNLEYVDTQYLSKLMEATNKTSMRSSYDQSPSDWSFVLVDARPANVYDTGHINGSINIPDSEFDNYKELLPADKDKLIIFYCGGLTCHLSANSAKKAEELGYTNVKVYQEGVPAWEKAGNYLIVTENYVKDLIMETYVTRVDNAPYLIIDARPYKSYFDEHIPNAIQADDITFTQKYIGTAPADKGTELIIYCGGFTCEKSHSIAEDLMADGYTNVKVFAGGLPVWKSERLPTFGMNGDGRGFNVAEGKVNRALTPDQFVERVNTGATVLDVRSEDERSHGAIPGSIHIPDSIIHADPKAIADQLPADKNATIVIHCASGARAAGVVDKIADLGYKNTYYLNSSITINQDGKYSF